MAAQQPKYNFGLLQTPMSNISGYESETSTENFQRIPRQNVDKLVKSGGHDWYKHSSSVPTGLTSNTSSTSFPGARKRGRGQGYTTPRSSSSLRTPDSRRTPASVNYSTTTPRESTSSIIVAIVEGRGLAKGEIGLASLDLKCPFLILSQFSDTQTYVKTITKLQILQPIEIIVPNTACENGTMTKLLKLINDQFQNTSISTVQRKYFNETRGLQYVKQLCVPEFNTVEMEVRVKYYALAAAASLMKYVEFIQNIMYAPGSLKVVFHGSENTTMIDASTAKNLELLQNLRDPTSDITLYGILNYTKTPGGARLLRANILQPPSDLETITMRQDAVGELTEKEEVFYNLQTVIGQFPDVDHLLALLLQIPKQETIKIAESKITNIIYLKHTLELIEPLKEALKDCENPLLKAYCKSLEDPRFDIIITKISSVIHEDTCFQKGTLHMRTQKCFAVKPNINGLLDVARRMYTEVVDDISELVTQLGTQYSLPLKTSYNSARGFYIQTTSSGKDGLTMDNLPGIFIKATKVKSTLSFTTTDLIKLNARIQQSLEEIYLMANIVVTALLNDIRSYLGCLYKLTESVAIIDVLLSFAHVCTLSNYVRPEFTDTLAIKQGRHPILEKIAIGQIVPNNTYASDESNFLVVTGPNMSGKSTYIRQMALLQIMAQVGCNVPAEYASFRIADQIFSRISTDDEMETNSSTFTLEMKEVNYIIQNASNRSLVIIDELGRATSPEEGVGICHSICEYLIQLKAFTVFVTHFLELTNLDALYPNVENYCFDVQRSVCTESAEEKIIFTHTIQRGKTEERHYGMELARMSCLPRVVMEKAEACALKLSRAKHIEDSSPERNKQRAVFKLATRLVQTARNSRLDADGLRIYLQGMKSQYEKETVFEG